MKKKVRQIAIGGHLVGIIGLDEILAEVQQMQLKDDAELKTALLAKVKAGNYVPDTREAAYGRALLREYQRVSGLPVTETETSTIPVIRILGPGCYACDKMERDLKAILNELNVPADVQHIRDVNQIAEYGFVRTPTLVIDGKIVLNGRSLPRGRLKALLLEVIGNR